jgi:hypothetical protein
MGFFRALVAKGEKSERVVELTGDLIKLNPGHYSVWCVGRRAYGNFQDRQWAESKDFFWDTGRIVQKL